MGKRKRGTKEEVDLQSTPRKKSVTPPKSSSIPPPSTPRAKSKAIQIITGSYDRVLHGFTATISALSDNDHEVRFCDTFLFNAHASAIRCLALSPLSSEEAGTSTKLILASGSTDERINLYHVSASTPVATPIDGPSLPSLASSSKLENPKNRELGSLLHHSSTVTALYFSSRSKLLSASEDNTMAVSRTRDWTVLSSIKAPIPKAIGRPSGDTAPLGGTPAGVNDFAVHPSNKLIISVGKGEKCMRLWNLVTGKKAGVLTFERELLEAVGEGKRASGEGRKVAWNGAGDEFVVGFEYGAAVFGMDSNPTSRVVPVPRTKLHQIRYVSHSRAGNAQADLLAVSTEDGRIMFYSTIPKNSTGAGETAEPTIPASQLVYQLGGRSAGIHGRIKDFEILPFSMEAQEAWSMVLITAGSDGKVRLWKVTEDDLSTDGKDIRNSDKATMDEVKAGDGMHNISNGITKDLAGRLLGTYETGNRITCMKAFVMLSPVAPSQDGCAENDDEEFTGVVSSAEESEHGLV